MSRIEKIDVAPGIVWLNLPDHDLRILCGCPEDSIKHLMLRGLVVPVEHRGVHFETGPNAILLSDVSSRSGLFCNLAEFPVLQMLYRQGMLLPKHPNNTGKRPILIGSEDQIRAQMEYIFRGNYGLATQDELRATGLSEEQVSEAMRIKLLFAFGRIRPSEELLDGRILNDSPMELVPGVWITRQELNVFSVTSGDECVLVDLAPRMDSELTVPFSLGAQLVGRDYFAVVHSGQGDGWDTRRTAMSGIVVWQGKLYLVDAGPNLNAVFAALGIGVNEIEGFFLTHIHDDHFGGIAALMQADRRIPFYATADVAAGARRKLEALMGGPEFDRYFDVRTLTANTWNDVAGMQVSPFRSPHPVENTPMIFRARKASGGFATYGHWADLVSMQTLTKMLNDGRQEPAAVQAFLARMKSEYLLRTDVKKVDIGGGLIHGDAEDFTSDSSGKIILAHVARPLTLREREIGCGAPFGTTDVLIPANRDYVREQATERLNDYFPGVAPDRLEELANCPIDTFPPETILIPAGDTPKQVLLLLTGSVEMLRSASSVKSSISPGGIIGDVAVLRGRPAAFSYRTRCYVRALSIPAGLFREFVRENGLWNALSTQADVIQFMRMYCIFGNSLSFRTQQRLAQSMEELIIEPGVGPAPRAGTALFILRTGRIELRLKDELVEILGPGSCVGENAVLHGTPDIFTLQTLSRTTGYALSAEVLRDIPVIRQKLQETHENRLNAALFGTAAGDPEFAWRQEYSVDVAPMDDQHRRLLRAAARLSQALRTGTYPTVLPATLMFLADYTRRHFADEERLMALAGYPDLDEHKAEHRKLLEEVARYSAAFNAESIGQGTDLMKMLRTWIMEHIRTVDRNYAPFLAREAERGLEPRTPATPSNEEDPYSK